MLSGLFSYGDFMNINDEAYLSYVEEIASNGIVSEDRTGDGTISLFGTTTRFDLTHGFPLFTGRKIFFNGIVHELFWFLRGETNIRSLVKNKCNIWNKDAIRWANQKGYNKIAFGRELDFNSKQDTDLFLEKVMNYEDLTAHGFEYDFGDLGPVYGRMWRRFGPNNFDQLGALIEQVKKNPSSRRHVLTAWDPEKMLEDTGNNVALPCCHYGFQLYVRNSKLSMKYLMRSNDAILGSPFNIASYAILCHIIAFLTGNDVNELIQDVGDAHIYLSHFNSDEYQKLMTCKTYHAPRIHIVDRGQKTIDDFIPDDIVLLNYESGPKISFDMLT